MMGSACLFCSLVCFISFFCSSVQSYPSPLTDCDDYGNYIQGSAVLSSLCGVEWRNQDQEQIQNVFKRFLFHYSKAHNSVGSVEREVVSLGSSAHASLTQALSAQEETAEKLKNVCGSSGRRIRDLFCSYLGL